MIRIPAIAAALVAATAAAVCVAQSTRTPSVRWPGYTPNMFRWDEDYRFLRDQPGLALFPYRLKYIALSEDGARYASLGGEYRFRVDEYQRPDFGLHNAADFASVAVCGFVCELAETAGAGFDASGDVEGCEPGWSDADAVVFSASVW